MPTIDGDAHVMEGPQTWEYCDPSERKFMPVLLNPGAEADRQFWLVDGKIRGHVRHVIKPKDFHALAEASGRDMVVPPEAQHLEDVPARIRHMDEMGIDIQVMYPTIFIQQVTDKPEFEVPICKAYNRWMADVWKQGNGRLRWVCVLPLLSLQDSIDMLPWCKENGAVAVLMRPFEGDRLIQDPYFYPLYEAMTKLDLPVGMHIGNANPHIIDTTRQRVGYGAGFWSMSANTAGACHAVITSKLPEIFPGCASASSKRRLSGFPGSSRTSSGALKDESCRTIFRDLPSLCFLLQQHRRYRIHRPVFHRECADDGDGLRPCRHVGRDRCAAHAGKERQSQA